MTGPPPPRCRCDQDLERIFDEHEARRDLEEWQRDGLPDATAELIDALCAEGVTGAAVLDVGAGVGMVHLELLAAGAAAAVDVDASSAYLAVAQSEAERMGWADRVQYRHGDLVAVAPELSSAEVVTLDRVVCCYRDLAGLLMAVSSVRPRLIGMVYPTDTWWSRASSAFLNAVSRLFRRHHFFFVHQVAEMDRLLAESGFTSRYQGGGRYWKVAVYERAQG